MTTNVATPALPARHPEHSPEPRPVEVGDRRVGRIIRVDDLTRLPGVAAIARRNFVYRRLLAFGDVFAAAAALLLSVQVMGDDQVRTATLLALPLVVVVSKAIGLYDRDELLLTRGTLDEAPKLFNLAGLYTLTLLVLDGHLILGSLGSDQALGMWALFFLTVFGARAIARSAAARLSPPERCIVVGDREDCDRLAEKIHGNRHVNVQVVGQLPFRPGRANEERWSLEAIGSAVACHEAERMILAPWSSGHTEVVDLVRIAKGLGVNVSVLPGLFEAIGSRVEFDELDGMPVLGVRRLELARSSRQLKRATDIVGSALLLAVTAPLLAALALAVRLDSRGPAFFRQERVGRDGRRFRIWKLRTMVPGAERMKSALADLNETAGVFKIADDPRVTRLGRLLRRTSLDELPQLLNVLRGEMSLVGPRPLVADEDRLVEGLDRRRLRLTPGMTGPWQILGAGRIPLQEMVKIDYLYVTGWSLWNDVKILLRTAAYVAARRSA